MPVLSVLRLHRESTNVFTVAEPGFHGQHETLQGVQLYKNSIPVLPAMGTNSGFN